MNPAWLSPIGNHLWQSTLLAGVAGLLTLTLRKNHARVRHSVWLAASCKFLVPLSLLIALGGHVRWRTVPEVAPSSLSAVMDQVSQPFAPSGDASPFVVTAPRADIPFPTVVLAIWLCGFLGIACSWWVRWRRIRATTRAGSLLHLEIPIQAVSSPTLVEPSVFGVFRPVLLLPEGLLERLTPAQSQTIITHELCHVRHRDNLIASIHMFVETVFWFHPLVWWIGKRMVEERERACDEEVLRLGSEPRVYAEGILNVCKLYLESPLVCVAGVTGANLNRRVEAIMANRVGQGLNRAKKLLLAGAGIAALAGPIAIGTVCSPTTRAQTPSSQAFEVASVKPTKPGTRDFHFFGAPNQGIDAANVPLNTLILSAYNLKSVQLTGGPDWIHDEHYDIVAKAPPNTTNRSHQMLQTLLADRFKLITHRETRVLPVLALVLAKGGPKFGVVKETRPGDGDFKIGRGRLSGQAVTMQDLADMLVNQVDRIVLDKTGLTGKFDINLQWTPDVNAAPGNDREVAPDPDGPSLATALSEQLGLRFEATKAPVPILVIDHVERPTAN